METQQLFEKYGAKFDKANAKKGLEEWVQVPVGETTFFSTCSPDVIEQRMEAHIDKMKLPKKQHDTKYKLRFVQTGAYEGGDTYEVHMIMRITVHGDKQVVVEFKKEAGDQVLFLQHFNEYLRGPLSDFDDSDPNTYA